MYDQLPIILQLQEIDSEIDKLENLKKEIPLELQALSAELAKHRQKLQAQSDALEELKKARRSKDRHLLIQQEQLEKYKSQLLTVKTNKEYTALESEIADLEESNSDTEDEILELMISIDEATDALESDERELKAYEGAFNKKKEELLSYTRKLDKDIAKWNNERSGYVGKVVPALINRYNNWRKRRGSSLIAVIQGQSCGSCHLTLPPQLINEVRKKTELHTCNSCGRILFWKDEVEL